jgi:hypothetical protein
MKQTSIPFWPKNAASSQNWSGAIVLCWACVWVLSCSRESSGESVSRVGPGNRFWICRPDCGGEARCALRTERTVRFRIPLAWRYIRFARRSHTLLASSAEYLHQAFRFGSCAYGLQFHIKPDSDIWSDWHEHLPPALIERAEQKRYVVERVGRSIIAGFFDVALGGRLAIERRREA